MKSISPQKIHGALQKPAGSATAFRSASAALVTSALLVLLAGPVSAGVVFGDTNLNIEVSEITPNPARPGEDLLIRINLENSGDNPAEDIIIGIEEQYPFTFKYSTSPVYGSGTNTERTFKVERIRQRSKVELNFHFRVDEKAKSGAYQLEFTVRDENGVSFSKRIPVQVEGSPDLVLTGTRIAPLNASLNINANTSSSGALVPGQAFGLLTTVKNAGNGNAKNVRVTLDLNGSSPIVPLEDNVFFLESLEAGCSENFSFKLLLGSNAEVQPYRIPLRITASNEAETMQIDRAQEIGINVLNEAKINIASLKFDPEMPIKGQQVSMVVRLENVGDGEARFVKARLEGLNGSGSTNAFLGRLDKDDDAPAVFTFLPQKSGEQEVTLLVEYEDDFGEHQLREDFSFSVANGSSLQAPLIAGAVLILAAAVFYIKKKN